MFRPVPIASLAFFAEALTSAGNVADAGTSLLADIADAAAGRSDPYEHPIYILFTPLSRPHVADAGASLLADIADAAGGVSAKTPFSRPNHAMTPYSRHIRILFTPTCSPEYCRRFAARRHCGNREGWAPFHTLSTPGAQHPVHM